MLKLSCSYCAASVRLNEKRREKGVCQCKTAFYCSRKCKSADIKRHKPRCSNTEAKRILRKTFYGSAALFRVCCKIYHDPCEAYAYALLLRMGMPRLLLTCIPRSHQGDPYLYHILKNCAYDALSYVTTIYTVIELSEIREKRGLSKGKVANAFARAALAPPEAYCAVGLCELSKLAQVPLETANHMALALMLRAQDPLMGITQLRWTPELIQRMDASYDPEAPTPLQKCLDSILGHTPDYDQWVDQVD